MSYETLVTNLSLYDIYRVVFSSVQPKKLEYHMHNPKFALKRLTFVRASSVGLSKPSGKKNANFYKCFLVIYLMHVIWIVCFLLF